METTNISIKQAINISINVEVLKASIQGAWQASKQRVLQAIKQYCNTESIAQWMDRVVDDHPVISNVVLIVLGIVLAYQVLNYQFTTSL